MNLHFLHNDNAEGKVRSLLARTFPNEPPDGFIPLFITVSLCDKRRYEYCGKKLFWYEYPTQNQVMIIHSIMMEDVAPQLEFLGMTDNEIHGCYEVNKAGNAHFHGIIYIKNRYFWPINIADIKKLFMKTYKTNSYGVLIEECKHYKECTSYITKEPIAFYEH